MGGIYGWGYWLECIGVVSGCCCKEIYRFPYITYPYSTCIRSFCSSIPTSLLIFFMFCVLVYAIFVYCYNKKLLEKVTIS